jgi:thiol-disulfide isomerase/thioredoxin
MKNTTFIILWLFIASCYSKKPENNGLKGKPLPSFTLLLADSTNYFNTSNVVAGKPSAFFFFGPHCPYSRAQMEGIIDNIKILKDIQFYIFTITAFSEMKGFYNHYKLAKYPNIKVGIDTSAFFQNYFKIRGVPYIAIYGKDKKLKESFSGETSSEVILKAAEE